MKKLFLNLILVLFVIPFGMSQDLPSYVPTNGLVAYYPFNGNANDVSGNGYHGDLGAATQTNDRYNDGNAYYLDRNQSPITLPKEIFNFQQSDDFSISFWFTDDGSVNNNRLLSTESPDGNLRITKFNDNIAIQFGDYIEITEILSDWNHIVYTNSNKNEVVYLNGQLIYSSTDTASENMSYNHPFTIGVKASNPNNSQDQWKGGFDELGIWDRVIDYGEVIDIFRSADNYSPFSFMYNTSGSLRGIISNHVRTSPDDPNVELYNDASGDASFVVGSGNTASGMLSSAFGDRTISSGFASSSFGYKTEASGGVSVAFGSGTKATGGEGSFVFGKVSEATGSSSFSGGFGSIASGQTAVSIGYYNKSLGDASFSIGSLNEAQTDFSIAAGSENISSGFAAVTFGFMNTTSGQQAFSVGTGNTASGNQSIAIGSGNTSSGIVSTALGSSTTSTGKYATSAGKGTISSGFGSMAIGTYNIENSSDSVELYDASNTAFVIGNGADNDNRSDALVVKFDGTTTIAGDLNINSDAKLKANIISLGSTLAKLLQIEGKTYTLKKDTNQKQKIGLLAQDIEKVFPELVSENNGIKSVNYQGLVPVLINALKDQQSEIDELKSMVLELINKN